MRKDELRTPCYVVQESKLRKNLEILKSVRQETGCHILLAQKAFSMYHLYPLIGEYTDIRPDFEHKILKGRLLAEGKIRLLYFLVPSWNLYFNKDVKKTYEHIKSFKL